MSNGDYISPTLRKAYSSLIQGMPCNDPFDSEGPVGKFCKKNWLTTKKSSAKYKYPSMKDAARYKWVFVLSYFFMRITLRLIGPNKFYDLSKLLIHLSIYRKNPGLWKL